MTLRHFGFALSMAVLSFAYTETAQAADEGPCPRITYDSTNGSCSNTGGTTCKTCKYNCSITGDDVEIDRCPAVE